MLDVSFSTNILFLFVLLLVMVVLFLTEKIPFELTGLLCLFVLILFDYISPEEAFTGFSAPPVITLFSTFVIGIAFKHTGITQRMARKLQLVVDKSEKMAVLAVMLVASFFASFLMVSATVVLLMPVVMSLAMTTSIAPSRLLIPLAYAALLGGMCTLIGTSSNLISSSFLKDQGFGPFTFFDFTPIGIAVVLCGTIYMVFWGRKMLPTNNTLRARNTAKELAEVYKLHEKLFLLSIPANSGLCGKTIADSHFSNLLGVEILTINRNGEKKLSPTSDEVLQAKDLLLVGGKVEDLERLLKLQGMEVLRLTEDAWHILKNQLSGAVLAVSEGSMLIGKTLRKINFKQKNEVQVVGIKRDSSFILQDLGGIRLQYQDELYVLGDEIAIQTIADDPDFDILSKDFFEKCDFLHDSIFDMVFSDTSALVGLTLQESGFGELAGLTVMAIEREGKFIISPDGDEKFNKEDRLIVVGDIIQAQQLVQLGELKILSHDASLVLETDKIGVAEVVLPPRSKLIGKTLRDVNFREKYSLHALALWKDGVPKAFKFSNDILRLGSTLLLQGPRSRLALLNDDPDFVVLTETSNYTPIKSSKAVYVLLCLLLMVTLNLLNIFPIHVSAFIAALLTVISGAVSMREVYDEAEWRILFLVAALLPFGIAFEKTGAAQLIAQTVLDAVGSNPYVILATFMLLSSLLSQLLDSTLSVILLSPIAFKTAEQIGISPYPLMMGIPLSVSVAFLFPFSHKASLLVMAPGGYKAKDYSKVGVALTIVALTAIWILVPLFFPF